MKFDHYLVMVRMTYEKGDFVLWAEYGAMCDGL